VLKPVRHMYDRFQPCTVQCSNAYKLISCMILFDRYVAHFLHQILLIHCLECIPEPPDTSVSKNKNVIVDCKVLGIFIELG
jgi:hypothetical protein